MEAAPGPGLTLRRWAPELAFLALWSLQGLLAALTPGLADEAYYAAWSRDLRLGYLDHPPGVAWWMALGPGLGRPLTWFAGAVGWWGLARAAGACGVQAWRWIPALALATPLGLSHALVITPDAPSLVAWLMTLAAVLRRRPVWAGLGLGLALWCKSTVVLAVPGLCWVLGGRRAAITLGVAAAVYAPHLAWSVDHGGLPWSFQARRRATGGAPVGWLAGQVAVLGPAMAWAVWKSWRAPVGALGRDLRRLSLPTAVAWLGVACATRAELNWSALAWPAAVAGVAVSGGRLVELARWGSLWTISLGLAWATFSVAGPLGWGPPRDGDRLAACLAERAPGPWVAGRYQEAGLLRLVGHPVPYARARGHRPSQFDLTGPRDAPPCGYWYLARADRAPPCDGPAQPAAACGRDLTWCGCPGAAQRVTPGGSPAYAPNVQRSAGGLR